MSNNNHLDDILGIGTVEAPYVPSGSIKDGFKRPDDSPRIGPIADMSPIIGYERPNTSGGGIIDDGGGLIAGSDDGVSK